MAVHRVTRVLPYTPAQLADLVADVEAYPRFVKWVSAMRVWNRREESPGVSLLDAEAAVGFSFLKERFATWVRHDKNAPSVEVGLLRGPFRHFGEDYRSTGRFAESLDRLKEALADPVGDRVVEALRLARDVGGTDLGRLLRTLSTFLREDARTRAELETRQGWTVNAARLALCSPWALLLLLSLQPETVRAYDSTAGALVLLVGGGTSLVAYRIMLRVARLPDERRVLR